MNLSRVITGMLSSHIRRSSQWPSIHRSPFTALQLASLSAEADAPADAPAKRTFKKVTKRMPEKSEESLSVPPPTDIPFQTKVANVVHLIGSVVVPVKVQMSPNGSFVATSVISREEVKGLPDYRIPIIFVGAEAQIAASYLKENDVIYVTGKLCGGAEAHTIKDSTTNIQVLVDSLSVVQNVFPGEVHDNVKEKVEPTSVPEDNRSPSDYRKNMVNAEEDEWNDLVLNPHNWWDYRTDKLNGSVKPRYPDFKNKGTAKALWLSSCPSWVLPKLNGLVFDTNRLKKTYGNSDSKIPTKQSDNDKENLWKSLLDDPNQWWDNRSSKKSSRQPDFKHKKTGEALWLGSTTPQWILEKYPPMTTEKNVGTSSSSDTLLS